MREALVVAGYVIVFVSACKFDPLVRGDGSINGDAISDDAPADTAEPSALGAPCNPLAATDCHGINNRCTWFKDDATSGHAGCAPAGNVPAGAECSFAPPGPTGYSNCTVGTDCFAGLCRTLCDPSPSNSCTGQFKCSFYNGLFDAGGKRLAGGCDANCDPLTQRRLADGAEACGSPTPTSPTIACYGTLRSGFGCTKVLPEGQNRTDRMTPHGAGGGPFLNGCAAGFLPYMRESTGSTASICAGVCAVEKTDITRPASVRGNASALAKLANQPAPLAGNGVCEIGKHGSQAASSNQNCRYAWFFEHNEDQPLDPNTPLLSTLGVCFAQQFYQWDSDNDLTPDRTFASCHQLPPRTSLPANCTCDPVTLECSGTGCPDRVADAWGCWPFADTSFPAIAPPIRAPFAIAPEAVRHNFE